MAGNSPGRLFTTFSYILSLLAAWVLSVGPALAAGDVFGPVDCAALATRAPEPRWLSLPMSRLVVNPFFGQYVGHAGVSGWDEYGALPVHLAYYVGAKPAQLRAFWSLQPADRSPAALGFVAGPRLGLSDAAQWQAIGVTATFGGESVRVTPVGDYGAIERTVMVDLDKTPNVVVQTPPGSPAFDIKVNGSDHPVDIALKPTERLGAVAADVSAATGWHGIKTFHLLLYALGRGVPTTFTRVQFLGLPALPTPMPSENVWRPDEITDSAAVGGTAGRVDSTVIMPGPDAVSQRLHVGAGGPASLVLAGRFAGVSRWDTARGVLLLQGPNFSAALSVSRKARWLGVRPTPLDWALDQSRDSQVTSGVWRLALDGLRPGEDVIVTARFAPSAGGMARVRDAVRAQASPAAFAVALKENGLTWNRRLARVPRPRDFTPRSVDARGVTAADVRRSYYRAWVFFWQDTLPPMPENGFPYPQVCTGKPSLWTDGAPGSGETAEWDGAVAMQALALVEPDVSWAAVQGLLSQVGPDGYLPGELLPPILAQTVWGLYRQTGNRDKLRSAYPALKRFLVWRIANPHWVYPNKSRADVRPSGHKSNEFVQHEIVDMGYALKIANALGMPGEEAFWRQQRQQAAADYLRWFRPDPNGPFYEDFDPGWTPPHAGGDIPWTLKGLQLDSDLLPLPDRQYLLTVFRQNFRPDTPFGITQNRFGDLEPITLGLFGSGQADAARQMADLAMRDVTRAGDFSEDYTQTDPPAPNGVRPSAFGARLMTDSVLWHNGVVLDQGFPVLLGMPGAVGVDNVPVQGQVLSVRFDTATQTVTLSGPALARLRLPTGFRAATLGGKTTWAGPIAKGQTIALNEGIP